MPELPPPSIEFDIPLEKPRYVPGPKAAFASTQEGSMQKQSEEAAVRASVDEALGKTAPALRRLLQIEGGEPVVLRAAAAERHS